LLAVLERRLLRRVGSTRERAVAAWFIAATNRPLEEMVARQAFRSDLYYRLKVLTLHLPPLRDRGEDVLVLARHYAARTARRYGMPAPDLGGDACAAMFAYSWPGNVRELVNVVERAVLLCGGGTIGATALGLAPALAPAIAAGARRDPPSAPAPAHQGEGEDTTLPEMEARLIRDALRDTGGNVSAAARRLGISRMRLRYRLQKHAIDPADFSTA
ncbi:MAG: sigma-54-dependent Fis family transcriptional regulator, partial [Planctomycetes bacterium]|nr:sigma-54-dependent Fis family transcriptional regulator [Planctomycetota bacterium]